jgi:hypothetical protein
VVCAGTMVTAEMHWPLLRNGDSIRKDPTGSNRRSARAKNAFGHYVLVEFGHQLTVIVVIIVFVRPYGWGPYRK